MDTFTIVLFIYAVIVTAFFIAARCAVGKLSKAKSARDQENRGLQDQAHRLRVDKQNLEKKNDEYVKANNKAADTIDNLEAEASALRDQVENQSKTIQGKDKTIAKLEKDLEKAQKNDMPKDPKTGKFTKKPAKKAAKKATKKATKAKK